MIDWSGLNMIAVANKDKVRLLNDNTLAYHMYISMEFTDDDYITAIKCSNNGRYSKLEHGPIIH